MNFQIVADKIFLISKKEKKKKKQDTFFILIVRPVMSRRVSLEENRISDLVAGNEFRRRETREVSPTYNTVTSIATIATGTPSSRGSNYTELRSAAPRLTGK